MTTLSPKVISHAGASIDLSQVKCFVLSNFTGIGKPNTLTIEFKKRLEYVFNPNTKQYEKEEINDTTEIEFPSYATGRQYTNELEEIWQDYLNEQK
ncbi:MAG: hypothetical protein QM541_08185 [Flavobacterium sp.]|nr:hypothetical protein [Flavobacterium sp.]